MDSTLNGFELCRALCQVAETASKLRISDMAIRYSESGRLAKVNVQTIDGRYLSVKISTGTNTPTETNETGGPNKE